MSEPRPARQPDLATARRLSATLIVFGLVLSAALTLLLVVRLAPTGVPGEWEWPWRLPDFPCPPSTLLVLPVGAVPLAVFLWLWRRPDCSRRAAAGLVALCCLAGATTMLLLEAEEPLPPLHLATATASLPATGYFGFATAVPDVRSVLVALSGRETPSPLPPRVKTHPPGPVLFYFLGLRALDQWPELTVAAEDWAARRHGITPTRFQALSQWTAVPSVAAYHFGPAIILGMLCTLLGALLPLPVYWAVAALHGRRAALIGALCAASIPSLTVFIPSIDGMAAVLGMTAVAVWLWALRDSRPWTYALAGLALAAAIFWSFGVLAVGVAMAAAALPSLRATDTRRPVLRGLLAAAGTFVGVFVILYVAGGYSVLGNVRMMAHWQSLDMAHAQRAYAAWLTGNLYDTMMFMGPALLLAVCAALPLTARLSATARYYLAGGAIALALLWLSGSTLGEVGRIWLFMMALLLPGAPLALAELEERKARPLVVLLVLAQVALTLMIHCRLALVRA